MTKFFNRWDADAIQVQDPGLKRYISLTPIMVPKTGGRNVKTQFHRSKTSLVERLINKLMVPGHKGKRHKVTSRHATGKAAHCYAIVQRAFVKLEQQAKRNPVEVFVRAVENAAPREEINTIQYGGARYPQAVECGPQRRIDLALRLMVQGAYGKSFGTKRKIEDTLAEEILLAFQADTKSNAVAKKLELERQADASR